jgi:hypothetical protein
MKSALTFIGFFLLAMGLFWAGQGARRTLNQRVQGSSPCAPTSKINNLDPIAALSTKLKSIAGNILGNILHISQIEAQQRVGRPSLLRCPMCGRFPTIPATGAMSLKKSNGSVPCSVARVPPSVAPASTVTDAATDHNTQQFNTTTSMGRLTLNVLLSFAQFEREVTAERIAEWSRQHQMLGLPAR